MEGLYKKIIKGNYLPIPEQYSWDLDSVVKTLLNVNPDEWPDCVGILNLP